MTSTICKADMEFSCSIGIQPMDEWPVQAVTGEALTKMAETQ